ncbi:MAG: Gfo/Idh/MocA family oxidoreductase [Deferribacteres bacterium]|nr:Gfo/Idh/MocA family oxidoreductase [candidate division KSB1 bacterium]MCB9501482.1 Gfo/Idh/MocA family oxidoreductase [Deferribacteres bacterium]
MNTKKVKIGIIGAGKIAQIAHIPQWKKIPEAEIISVCDVQASTAESVSKKYNVSSWSKNPDDIFKNEEIDAVDICTDTQSHKDLAIAALSAGKHVLVEKPFALTYADAMEMVAASEKYDRLLMAAMNVRFRKELITLKSFIKGKELGDVFSCKVTWFKQLDFSHQGRHWLFKKEKSGGGVLMDLGIQMLDASWWLLGNPAPVAVKAKTFNYSSKFDVEDTAFCMIEFENGAILNMDVSWSILAEKETLSATFFGTEATATINPLCVYKKLHGNLINIVPTKDENSTLRYIRSYHNELKHFVTCIQQNTRMISNGREAASRLQLIEAIYQSANEGREVLL